MPTLVTNKQVPSDGFARIVARYIREASETARAALPDANAHHKALSDLADFVDGLPMQDQRLRALWLANGQDSDSYSPGEDQQRFFGLIGDAASTVPSHDEAISELVACAVSDFQQHRRDEITAANKQVAEGVAE